MKDIAKKITDKLEKGWYEQLKMFWESSDFISILEQLKKKVDEEHQRFCPSLLSTEGNTTIHAFRQFTNIPYSDIKAVVLTDYITNSLEVSNGLPFGETVKMPDIIIRGLVNSIEPKQTATKWEAQGVLFLPLALTTRLEGRAHKKIWQPLIIRVIEAINRQHKKVPWVLLGKDSANYKWDIISPYIRQVELKYPMTDNNWSQWINECIVKESKIEIKW